MAAAANFAWCNRQALTHQVRQVFERIFGDAKLRVVYDVAHNIAKIETYGAHRLCVHRKGATRAFGPSSEDVPPAYRSVGQPVFIPGSMGTASFVLVGTDAAREISLGSACHGAGRTMSRAAAKREVEGHALRKELAARGIVVECPSNAELAEEAPQAYKDVARVVDVDRACRDRTQGRQARPARRAQGIASRAPHPFARRLGCTVSCFASISTNVAMRRARVSSFAAVCTR